MPYLGEPNDPDEVAPPVASSVAARPVRSPSPKKQKKQEATKPQDVFVGKLIARAKKSVAKGKAEPFQSDEFHKVFKRLQKMNIAINDIVPENVRRTLTFVEDNEERKALVESMLGNSTIRKGFRQLHHINSLIVDTAAYLGIELFGVNAVGTTKAVQVVLRKCPFLHHKNSVPSFS